MKIKTSELSGVALDWAYLFAIYGDGPDWRVIDGQFGVVSLRDIRVGMDGHSEIEDFQEYRPQDIYGEVEVRRVVAAKLGDEVDVPEGLV